MTSCPMSHRPADCAEKCEVCVLDLIVAGGKPPPRMFCSFTGTAILEDEGGEQVARIIFALGAEGEEPIRFMLCACGAVKLIKSLAHALSEMDDYLAEVKSGGSAAFDPNRLSRS